MNNVHIENIRLIRHLMMNHLFTVWWYPLKFMFCRCLVSKFGIVEIKFLLMFSLYPCFIHCSSFASYMIYVTLLWLKLRFYFIILSYINLKVEFYHDIQLYTRNISIYAYIHTNVCVSSILPGYACVIIDNSHWHMPRGRQIRHHHLYMII